MECTMVEGNSFLREYGRVMEEEKKVNEISELETLSLTFQM